MLAKLLRFVLITRFSKPFLAVVAFFLGYQVLIRTLVARDAPVASRGFSYYAVGFSIFFITLSLLFGGLFVMKSDRDFLLTLPLSRRELSLVLFIAQFIGFGTSLLFFFGFYVPGRGLAATSLFAADLVFFALMITSLGVISNILEDRARVALIAVLAVWCLSSLAGFQFTPVSIFTGSLLYGSVILAVVTGVVVPVALRELSQLELGSMRSLLKATKSDYSRNMSFSGRGPVGAIYAYHLSLLELAGRINLGGTASYRTARVRTSRLLIVTAAAAIVYYVLASPIANLSFTPVGVISIVLGIITLVLISQGTFSNERGWLAFTAMDPATYLRHLVLSRAASALVIVGPFAVANIVLAFQGIPTAVNSSIVLLFTVPCASIITSYFVGRFGEVQQVREEGMMPGPFNLRQMLLILPTYVVLGLIISSEFSLRISLVIATILGILALFLMLRGNPWRKIANVLTERGFV